MQRLLVLSDHSAKAQTSLGTLVRHVLHGIPRDIFDDITYFGAPLGDEPDILEVQQFNYADYTHVLCINNLLAGGSIKPFIGTAKVALYLCEPTPYMNLDVFDKLEFLDKIITPSGAVKQALLENSVDSPLEVIEKASVVVPGINFREYHNHYISSGDMLREDILHRVVPGFTPQDYVIFCDAKDAPAACHMFQHLRKNLDTAKLLIRANREEVVAAQSIVNGNDIPEDCVAIRTPKTTGDNAALYLISNLIYRPSTYGFWSFTMHEAMCMNIPVAAGDDYVVGDMISGGAGIPLPTSEFVPQGNSYVNRVNSYDAAKAVEAAYRERYTMEAGTVTALAKYAVNDYKASARALIKEAFGL